MCNVYTHRVAQLKRSSEKMQIPQWDTTTYVPKWLKWKDNIDCWQGYETTGIFLNW